MSAMTVKALIRKLRSCPPEAIVAWQNHDQSLDEIDGYVRRVDAADPSLIEARRDEIAFHGAKEVVVLS